MLISIVIPVYNAAETLQDCVESIACQSIRDFEVLLIDDASTDNSPAVCDALADQFHFVRVFHVAHGGVSAARNFGIKEAKGEYIRFIDADDSIPTDSLEKLLRPFRDDPETDLVIGGFTTTSGSYFVEQESVKLNHNEFMLYFLRNFRSYYYGVVWNKLFRTDLIRDHRITFEEGLHWSEDMLFNCCYYTFSRSIVIEKSSVYSYYVVEGKKYLTPGVEMSGLFSINFKRLYNVYLLTQSISNDNVEKKRFCEHLITRFRQMLQTKAVSDGETRSTWVEYYHRILRDPLISSMISDVDLDGLSTENRVVLKLMRKGDVNLIYSYFFFRMKLKNLLFRARGKDGAASRETLRFESNNPL